MPQPVTTIHLTGGVTGSGELVLDYAPGAADPIDQTVEFQWRLLYNGALGASGVLPAGDRITFTAAGQTLKAPVAQSFDFSTPAVEAWVAHGTLKLPYVDGGGGVPFTIEVQTSVGAARGSGTFGSAGWVDSDGFRVPHQVAADGSHPIRIKLPPPRAGTRYAISGLSEIFGVMGWHSDGGVFETPPVPASIANSIRDDDGRPFVLHIVTQKVGGSSAAKVYYIDVLVPRTPEFFPSLEVNARGTHPVPVSTDDLIAEVKNGRAGRGAGISSLDGLATTESGHRFPFRSTSGSAASSFSYVGAGDHRVEATLKDTRGRVASGCKYVRFYKYSELSILSSRAFRANSIGEPDEYAGYVKVNASASVTYLNATATYQLSRQPLDAHPNEDDQWTPIGSAIAVPFVNKVMGEAETLDLSRLLDLKLGESDGVRVRFKIQDSVQTRIIYFEIPPATYLMSVDTKSGSVGIGVPAPVTGFYRRPVFEVAASHNARFQAPIYAAGLAGDFTDYGWALGYPDGEAPGYTPQVSSADWTSGAARTTLHYKGPGGFGDAKFVSVPVVPTGTALYYHLTVTPRAGVGAATHITLVCNGRAVTHFMGALNVTQVFSGFLDLRGNFGTNIHPEPPVPSIPEGAVGIIMPARSDLQVEVGLSLRSVGGFAPTIKRFGIQVSRKTAPRAAEIVPTDQAVVILPYRRYKVRVSLAGFCYAGGCMAWMDPVVGAGAYKSSGQVSLGARQFIADVPGQPVSGLVSNNEWVFDTVPKYFNVLRYKPSTILQLAVGSSPSSDYVFGTQFGSCAVWVEGPYPLKYPLLNAVN